MLLYVDDTVLAELRVARLLSNEPEIVTGGKHDLRLRARPATFGPHRMLFGGTGENTRVFKIERDHLVLSDPETLARYRRGVWILKPLDKAARQALAERDMFLSAPIDMGAGRLFHLHINGRLERRGRHPRERTFLVSPDEASIFEIDTINGPLLSSHEVLMTAAS